MAVPLVLLIPWAPQASIALLTLWVRYGPTIGALMTEGATPVATVARVRVAAMAAQSGVPEAIQQAHALAGRVAEAAARGKGFGDASFTAVYLAAKKAAENATRRRAPTAVIEKETREAANKRAAELARSSKAPPPDSRPQAAEAWNEWLATYRVHLNPEQLENIITLVKSTQLPGRYTNDKSGSPPSIQAPTVSKCAMRP